MTEGLILGIALGIFTTVIFIGFFWFLKKWHLKKTLNLALNYGLLLIKLPKSLLQEKENIQLAEIIVNFENFLNSLRRIKQPIIFEIANPHSAEEIYFYLAGPKKELGFLEKNIKSFWPGSEVEWIKEDYTIFHPQAKVAGKILQLKAPYYLPIKTYPQLANQAVDPLDGLLGAFTKAHKEEEGLAYQIVVKPASSKINKFIQKGIKKIQEGKSLQEAYHKSFLSKISEIFAVGGKKDDKEKEIKPVDEMLIKNLQQKAQKPIYEVNIRMIASADDQYRAKSLLEALEGAVGQFANPPYNEFKIIEISQRNLRKFVYQFSFRLFNKKEKIYLNAEELATIFHFPTPLTKTPNICFQKSRTAPPPTNLPNEGIILGESLYRGERRLVRITKEDRRRHLYVIGQTGTGKTSLLKNLAVQDIEQKQGLCFIDPHGDVAEDLLGLVPEERIDEVIYFNPGSADYPIALNILEYDPKFPEQKTFIINSLIEIIDKLYDLRVTGGPMFEQYLRNSLLLIMDNPEWGYTLLEVSRVFVDETFRKDLLKKCQNYQVVEFWTQQVPRIGGELSLDNMITWITSKLNPFITNDFIRPIVAQPKSAINFREIMDHKKIAIVSIPKGILGETSSYLMGMIIITKILASAFSRMDIPEEQRQDFYLYIDEFQNFAFKTVASILAEARKYRLAMIMAHQYLGQLPEEIRNAVFGNVGTIVSFRIGIEDAEILEKQFAPTFNKIDLSSLPNFNAYLRLLIHGYLSDPFNITTIKPKSSDPQKAQKVKEHSIAKYGRPRKEIEEEIKKRYQYAVEL